MNFRNIIMLLFMVTVFSSAYSMGDLPGSPLSQEVDPDTGTRINYISPCVFSSMGCSVYSEEDPITSCKRRISEENLNRINSKYKEFENEIIRLNNLFEDGARSFLRYQKNLCNYVEYYKREHSSFFKHLVSLYNLRKSISESIDLTPQLKIRLRASLNGVERKISSLLFCLEDYTND